MAIPKSCIADVRSSFLPRYVYSSTLRQTKLFQPGCPLHDDLSDILHAHSVFWQGGKPVYAPGTSYLAGMLLVSMTPPDAFLALVNLINKSLLKTFYRGPKDDVGRVWSPSRETLRVFLKPKLMIMPDLLCSFVMLPGTRRVH